MKLICIGDSLTFGYGVRPSQRWTRLCAQETEPSGIEHAAAKVYRVRPVLHGGNQCLPAARRGKKLHHK